MLQAKQGLQSERKQKLKDQMNNDATKAFFVHLPAKEYWKLKAYLLKRQTKMTHWLREMIYRLED